MILNIGLTLEVTRYLSVGDLEWALNDFEYINILKATWNSVSVLYRTLLIYNIFCARPYSSQRPPTLFWLKAHNDPRAQLVLGTSGPEIER